MLTFKVSCHFWKRTLWLTTSCGMCMPWRREVDSLFPALHSNSNIFLTPFAHRVKACWVKQRNAQCVGRKAGGKKTTHSHINTIRLRLQVFHHFQDMCKFTATKKTLTFKNKSWERKLILYMPSLSVEISVSRNKTPISKCPLSLLSFLSICKFSCRKIGSWDQD